MMRAVDMFEGDCEVYKSDARKASVGEMRDGERKETR